MPSAAVVHDMIHAALAVAAFAVDVESYGLSTTATATANTAAINAALAAAVGGVCRIKTPGNYSINAALRIGSNTTFVIGAGVTLTLSNQSNCSMVVNTDTANGNTGIRLLGPGTLIGNQANQTAAAAEPGFMGHTVCFTRVSNLEVAYLNLDQCGPKFAIATRGGSNIHIHDNNGSTNASDFIHHIATAAGSDWTTINDTITIERNRQLVGGDDFIAVGIGDYDAYIVGHAASVQNLVIRDNWVGTLTPGGHPVALFIARPDNVNITNGGTDTNSFFFRDVQIEGNYGKSLVASGIVIGATSISGHTNANTIQNCMIRNNDVTASDGLASVQIGWSGDTCDITMENLLINHTGNNALYVQNITQASAAGKGANLVVNGIRTRMGIVPTAHAVFVEEGTTLNSLTVRSPKYVGGGSAYCVYYRGLQGKVLIEDPLVDGHGLLWYRPATLAGTDTHTQNAYISLAHYSSLNVANVWPMRSDSTLVLTLIDGLISNNSNEWLFVNALGGTVTILGGGGMQFVNGAHNRPNVNAGSLRINNPDATCLVPNDVAAPVAMDVCISTGGSITGRAICTNATGPVWAKWGWT